MTEQQLHDWNAKHPKGTPVLAWPGHPAEEPMRTFTRSDAWHLPAGDAVVQVEGHAGGIALTHIRLFEGDLDEHRKIMHVQQAERILWNVSREAKTLFSDGIDEWRRNQSLVSQKWAEGLANGGLPQQLEYSAKLGLLQWLQGAVDNAIAGMKKLHGVETPAPAQERGGVEL